MELTTIKVSPSKVLLYTVYKTHLYWSQLSGINLKENLIDWPTYEGSLGLVLHCQAAFFRLSLWWWKKGLVT